jgi:transcription elongation factor GreA
VTKVPITVNGAQKLRDEFQRLKKEDRPRIVSAIAEARAHGDLRENAEYHAAKEEQGFIEARIKQIDGMLSNAEIIDVTALTKTGKVVFGATVELIDEDSGKQVAYQIVGEDEADIGSGMLSFSSPIARALIGREEGDVVDVKTPGGDRSYEIVEVRYG